MTDDQYRVGLAAMAADIHSRMFLGHRAAAIGLLQRDGGIDGVLRERIHEYLEARRQCQQGKED